MKTIQDNRDGLTAGYCKNCIQMEFSMYGTVLNDTVCDLMKIDYYISHIECCEKAECTHPYWYSTT